jgi:hypothetical protein
MGAIGLRLEPMPKFNIERHNAGDFTLVIDGYTSGTDGINLTGAFATAAEVHEEFSKLEQELAKAKQKALRAVSDPEEARVRSGQRTMAQIIGKADPSA